MILRQFLLGIRAGCLSFFKYHMKILLGDVNAKLGREDILKLTVGNSNDNGVRIVNFATSKYLVIRSTIFPH